MKQIGMMKDGKIEWYHDNFVGFTSILSLLQGLGFRLEHLDPGKLGEVIVSIRLNSTRRKLVIKEAKGDQGEKS
jgi:hypothetical protein